MIVGELFLMKITVVVQQIPDEKTAYALLNFVRHLVAAGANGAESREYQALPKDTPVDGTNRIPRFSEPAALHNTRFSYADSTRSSYRMVFHFTGGREDLWRGTVACMHVFRDLTAVIITFESGGFVTVAKANPGAAEEITQRTFPEVLADQLEEEFAGLQDELDLLELRGPRLDSIDLAGFLDATAGAP
ncbi:MAG: hypothetical protein EA427_17095 [Spirochaetaceae bacterium]|nr:MAG: hypothetical protein EA427_17095 [Spirochaetaceae bacterium]